MKKLRAILYSRSFNITFSFILNIALIICLCIFISPITYLMLCLALTVLFFVSLLIKNNNTKTNFMILLLSVFIPVVAFTILRYSESTRGNKRIRTKWKELTNLETTYTSTQNNAVLEALSSKGTLENKTSKYINTTLCAPVYENNSVKFIANGQEYLDEVIKELKTAKKYIFIECSEIKDCKAWESIFEILKEKGFAGVEIKLLYDDYKSYKAFKDNTTFQKLYNHRIETMAFNPITFATGKKSTHRNYNNTIIIDGITAFSGQIGLQDDFIELLTVGESLPRYIGTAFEIHGDSVISIVKNFVSNWNLFAHSDALVLEKYLLKAYTKNKNKVYVQPFEINPLIKENPRKNIQNNLINCATKSIWITCPYLLIGNETKNSLIASARCGIDVNIIVSKEYAKNWINDLSYTNYGALIKEGIKIYAIENNKLHTQNIIIDENTMLLGAGNIDNRKMYNNFENGVIVYSEEISLDAINNMKMLISYCTQLNYKELKKKKFSKKLNGAFLKIFSPLM